MHSHLDLHNIEHKQRMKHVREEQLADELRKTNAKPNQALLQLGELLIDIGEYLQKNDHKQASPAH